MKIALKGLILLSVLWPASSAWGQVNVESDRHAVGGKEGFHLGTDLTLGFQKGNVDLFQYQLGSRIDYIQGAHHYYLMGSKTKGEENGKTFSNQEFAHLRWTFMWGERVGNEVFSQIETDEFKLLEARQLNGAGFRFLLAKMESGEVALGLGGMSDYESLKTGQSALVARGTSYLSASKTWENGMKGSLVGYYQPLFSAPSDYRVLVRGTLSFALTTQVSLQNEMAYAYDTKPPEGVIKDDFTYTLKIKYQWR